MKNVLLGGTISRSRVWVNMVNIESADCNGVRVELSEEDKELICLVAFGLTDGEIATQLQVPEHMVLDHVTRVLGKIAARERVELLLYAFSEPTLCQGITAKIANRYTTKTKTMEVKAS
jgi:DNA-binding NarL/FixJ family response regulator